MQCRWRILGSIGSMFPHEYHRSMDHPTQHLVPKKMLPWLLAATLISMRLALPTPLLFVGIAGWGVWRPQWSLFCMLVLTCFNVTNPLMVKFQPSAFFLQVSFAMLALSGLWRIKIGRDMLSSILSFIAFVSATSASSLLSEYSGVALFKVVVFSIFLTACWLSCILSKKEVVKQWEYIYAFIITFLMIGVALTDSPLAYPKNATGFAGITNHPQTLGVFLAVCGWILFFRTGKWVFLPFILWQLFITEARSGIYSFALSGIMTLVIYGYKAHFRISNKWLLAFVCLGSVYIAATIVSPKPIFGFSDLIEQSRGIALKRGSSQSVAGALVESRGFLAAASWQNFLESPWLGIGFQVSNGRYGSYPMEVQYESTFALPISAPIEKGFFWAALLEEIGIIGAIAFLSLIVSLFFWGQSSGSGALGFATFLAAILCNNGESVFMSGSGIGGFMWVFLFLSFWPNPKVLGV